MVTRKLFMFSNNYHDNNNNNNLLALYYIVSSFFYLILMIFKLISLNYKWDPNIYFHSRSE